MVGYRIHNWHFIGPLPRGGWGRRKGVDGEEGRGGWGGGGWGEMDTTKNNWFLANFLAENLKET